MTGEVAESYSKNVSALHADLYNHLGNNACMCLPAVHVFGRCDTTSAIYGHGKSSVFTHLTSSEILRLHCITLQSELATCEEVEKAGLYLMVAVYGGSESDSMASLR